MEPIALMIAGAALFVISVIKIREPVQYGLPELDPKDIPPPPPKTSGRQKMITHIFDALREAEQKHPGWP